MQGFKDHPDRDYGNFLSTNVDSSSAVLTEEMLQRAFKKAYEAGYRVCGATEPHIFHPRVLKATGWAVCVQCAGIVYINQGRIVTDEAEIERLEDAKKQARVEHAGDREDATGEGTEDTGGETPASRPASGAGPVRGGARRGQAQAKRSRNPRTT